MAFLALVQGAAGVTVERGSTLAEIDHNAILDAVSAHHDREVALFNQRQASGG
jgi:hypothetical protein